MSSSGSNTFFNQQCTQVHPGQHSCGMILLLSPRPRLRLLYRHLLSQPWRYRWQQPERIWHPQHRPWRPPPDARRRRCSGQGLTRAHPREHTHRPPCCADRACDPHAGTIGISPTAPIIRRHQWKWTSVRYRRHGSTGKCPIPRTIFRSPFLL